MQEVRIKIPYTARDAFKPYHENTKRFSVTVAHRRAGKTVARLNRIIEAAIKCEKLNPRFGYIAPFYVQAKRNCMELPEALHRAIRAVWHQIS